MVIEMVMMTVVKLVTVMVMVSEEGESHLDEAPTAHLGRQIHLGH